MAKRVYLHVGTMKSATTYLQGLLDGNPEALAAAGLLWQGSGANFSAVSDLLGKAKDASLPNITWQAFARKIADHPRDAVVSNELLSLLNRRRIQPVVDGLAPTELEVVVTARDLGRVIASQWQERARNRPMTSWAGFMDQLMAAGSRQDTELSWFWRRQDLGHIIDNWSAMVGADHITVVTVPPPGSERELIGARFGSVIGVDGFVEAPAVTRDNPTLGANSVELMRRIQQRLTDETREQVRVVLKHVLARLVLARRRSVEPAIGLSPAQYAWALAQAQATIDALSATGVRVVGDPEDLLPRQPDEGSAYDPGDTSSDQLLEVAIDAVIGLAESIDRQARAGGDAGYGEAIRRVAAADEPSE